MNLKVNSLSHITFICKDIDKTAYMFKHVFGAEEVYASGDKIFSVAKEIFLKLAGLWIAIMQGESVEKTYNHIAFQVDDADLPKFSEKILSLGLVILPSCKREEQEGESLYFYDYDNHLFELHTGSLDVRLAFYNKIG